MSEKNNDVLMYMTLESSGQVAAEARSTLDTSDSMVTSTGYYDDFTKGKFFELRTFSFGVTLNEGKKASEKGADGEAGKPGSSPSVEKDPDKEYSFWKSQPPSPMRDAYLKMFKKAKAKEVQFKEFLSGEAPPTTYSPQLSDITYERVMDKASPLLWNYFNERKVVTNAVILKRKNDGWSEGPQGYLAFWFKDLLITDIDWDEDEIVVEKVKMIARGAQIIYKIQQPDLDSADTWAGQWSTKPGLFS